VPKGKKGKRAIFQRGKKENGRAPLKDISQQILRPQQNVPSAEKENCLPRGRHCISHEEMLAPCRSGREKITGVEEKKKGAPPSREKRVFAGDAGHWLTPCGRDNNNKKGKREIARPEPVP